MALEIANLSHLLGAMCPPHNMFGGQMSSHANYKWGRGGGWGVGVEGAHIRGWGV